MEFELWAYAIFFIVGLVAGFIDAIAGGGGIITIPALLAFGIPPHIALATNKLQATFGSASASYNFIKKGFVDLKELYFGIFFTFVGACLGTYGVVIMSANMLEKVLPFLLICIFLYMLFSPRVGHAEKHALISRNKFFILFGLIIGFYDGFFGPATGTFWAFAMVGLLGLNLKQATAQTKILNFISNAVSLVVFALSVPILWTVGAIMGVGQLIGAYLGSNILIKKDVGFIRTIFLTMCALTILKVAYSAYF